MYLYGAKGHGKVIREIFESNGVEVDGFIDDNPELNNVSNLPVIHSAAGVEEVVISIGDNDMRKKVVERVDASNPDIKYAKAIHSSAIVSPSSEIGDGTVVMAGVLINAESKIGKHCIINTGASVDHECVLGDFVHVSPHATLCGNVTVGEGTWVGAGTTIIQGVTIGKWCIIGAGSVVSKNIPDGYLAVGNRCKLLKKLF